MFVGTSDINSGNDDDVLRNSEISNELPAPWLGYSLEAKRHLRDQLDKAIVEEEAALVAAEDAKRMDRIRELMAGPLTKEVMAEIHRLTANTQSAAKKSDDEKEVRLLAYCGTDKDDPNRVLYWYDHHTSELREVPEDKGISGKFGYYPSVAVIKTHLNKRMREAKAKHKQLFTPERFKETP